MADTGSQPRSTTPLNREVPPAVRAVADRLVALRWWIIGGLAIGRAILDGTSGLHPVDYRSFEEAGRTLLSAQWYEAFASSVVQTGPVQLFLHGVHDYLAEITGIDSRIWLSLMAQVGITVGTIVVARRAVATTRGRCPEWVELLIGLFVLVGGPSWVAYISGHPSDGFVALLWMTAAIDAREDRPVRAGLWVALAAGVKQWGILGAPVLLLGRRSDRMAKAFGVLLLGTAVLYGPFFLFGDVSTFEQRWSVESLSLPRLFLPTGSLFPWWMRLVQGIFVLVAGTTVAYAIRRRAMSIWIVPLALVLARLLSEPFANYYLWLAFDLIALVGVATLMVDTDIRLRIVLGIALYMELLTLYLPPAMGFVYHLAFAAGLITLGIRALQPEKVDARLAEPQIQHQPVARL